MCRRPFENVSYEFVLASPACPASLARLTWMICEIAGKWPYSRCFVRRCFRICSRLRTTFLYSSCLAFTLCVLLVSIWCIHIEVWTQLQKKSRFILPEGLDFHIINNLSILVYAYTRTVLTSLSVDKILLPRYVKKSTKFTGLLHRMEMAVFCLELIYCFISIHVEANAFHCLLKAMQKGFCSWWCICEKC